MTARPPAWCDLAHAPARGSRLCALADVVDGGVRSLQFGPATDPFRLLLLRSGDEVFGYVNRCPHFGVPLAAEDAHLIFKPHRSISCNVHYARFRWRDGMCEYGDCLGETLVPVPLTIAAGEICIAD